MDQRSTRARERQRARRARIYRRRRLGALLVLLMLAAAIAGTAVALGGSDDRLSAAVSSPPASPGPPTEGTIARPSSTLRLTLRDVIVDPSISPKSVVSSGTGYVFAQNMMYRHTMTVYDTRSLKLVKTIEDSVRLSDFGYSTQQTAQVRGAPVEAAQSPDGRFMYVSQYSMYGEGFIHQGSDACSPESGVDDSFVYRIPLDTLSIDQVIKVGAVPKFLTVTPNGRYLLVSNWCSYTLSVVDTSTAKAVKSIYLGPYPRGIAVDPGSKYAYVALMGGKDIARVDLQSWKVSWLRGVGLGPRHLVMSPDGRYLYASLNSEGTVAKLALASGEVVRKVTTGSAPRSMALAPDGRSLYVVNYTSNSLTKVRTSDMKVLQTVPTHAAPIGVTYDAPTGSVWVCCYSGSIMVFDDVPPVKTQTERSAPDRLSGVRLADV